MSFSTFVENRELRGAGLIAQESARRRGSSPRRPKKNSLLDKPAMCPPPPNRTENNWRGSMRSSYWEKTLTDWLPASCGTSCGTPSLRGVALGVCGRPKKNKRGVVRLSNQSNCNRTIPWRRYHLFGFHTDTHAVMTNHQILQVVEEIEKEKEKERENWYLILIKQMWY